MWIQFPNSFGRTQLEMFYPIKTHFGWTVDSFYLFFYYCEYFLLHILKNILLIFVSFCIFIWTTNSSMTNARKARPMPIPDNYGFDDIFDLSIIITVMIIWKTVKNMFSFYQEHSWQQQCGWIATAPPEHNRVKTFDNQNWSLACFWSMKLVNWSWNNILISSSLDYLH